MTSFRDRQRQQAWKRWHLRNSDRVALAGASASEACARLPATVRGHGLRSRSPVTVSGHGLRAGLEALELLDDSPEDDAWMDTARQVFDDGRAAVARGEYFQGSPADVIARARSRVENREHRPRG